MAQVFLSIGSNIRRQHYISGCLDALQQRYGELQISSIYESEAVGFDGDDFYNLVVGIRTEASLTDLYHQLRDIEHSFDRQRDAEKFSGRTLDIDILTYDDYVGAFAGGSLPRDETTKNAFVLWPLAEIEPQRRYPGSDKTYAELWAAYDQSKQKLWRVSFQWQGRELSSL